MPFLRKMSLRPVMYLYTETIFALEVYVSGYRRARVDLGFPPYGRGEETLLADFSKWLEEKMKLHDTRGWLGLIDRADPSPKSIHTFIRLFDEFLKTSAGVAEGLGSRPK